MMFKDKYIHKLYAFALAAVFALTLAGCGGGGGGTAATPPDETPMPTPQESCEGAGGRWNADMTCTTAEELAAAEAQALSAAQTAAQAAFDALADISESDVPNYTRASDANARAQAATTSQEAEAALADVQKYAAMVVAAKQAEDDAAAEAARLAAEKAARAAITKTANTKKAAIATEADPNTTGARPFDGGTPISGDGTSSPTADTMYRLTLKNDGSMSTVDVLDERNMLKGDPKFSSVARFGDGQMLVRDNSGTSREIIVLHTDIEADTPTAFTKVYPLNTNDDPEKTGDDNYRSLTVLTTGTPNHLAHIDLGIPAPGEDATATKTFAQDDSGTPAVNEGMHRGRFDGAMGTYLCSAADCSVTVDDEGKATAMAGTWTFTPDAGTTIDVADTNYLYYGFWLDTTTKDGKVTSYDTVQTFTGVGSGLTIPSRTLADITGSAEYTGGATGVYVHEVSKADGSNDYSTSGRFTADVYMHVHFDGTTNRITNSMRGSISNFELEHGEEQNWNVDIRGVVQSDYTFGTTGSASGMRGDNGSLAGTFYGAAGEEATDAPAAVLGEFNANFVNGSAAGAYGARLDD